MSELIVHRYSGRGLDLSYPEDYFNVLWEWRGPWWGRVVVAHHFMCNAEPRFLRRFRRRFVIVRPLGWRGSDYMLAMRRDCPAWLAVWLWYHIIWPNYAKCKYRTLVWLYLRGLAWWPEGSIVRWRDIGKKAPQ